MSNLPTVNVTARVYDQSGKPIHKAVVTMRLTTVERYSGYIVPREVRAETDAVGKAVLAVWPNELGTESSEYRVHIKYPHNGCESSCFNGGSGSVSGYAVVPNHDCDLQDIMELSPYEQRGAGRSSRPKSPCMRGRRPPPRRGAEPRAVRTGQHRTGERRCGKGRSGENLRADRGGTGDGQGRGSRRTGAAGQ